MEKNMTDPQKVKHGITMWPSSPTSEYIPEGVESRVLKRLFVHCDVHSSTTHNGQQVEATQMSTDERMVKRNVV